MINRRFQDFYHKQKKGILVVLFLFAISLFSLQQVSSTTTAIEVTPKPSIVPQPSYILPPSPTLSWTPGPSPAVTIYPQPTNIVPPSPALSWIPGPSVTSFPISPIMVSLTPTYTPTVTPTSTPYPTLPIYHFPVITTTSLPRGSLFKNYFAYVEGYDEDTNDNLTMKITNLPPGLSQNRCIHWKDALNRPNILCTIEGKPARMGLYNVKVDLYDGQMGLVGILKLYIGLR